MFTKSLSRRIPILSKVPLTRTFRTSLTYNSAQPRTTIAATSQPLSSQSSTSLAPTVATSSFLHQTRISSLQTPGIIWRDEEEIAVGIVPKILTKGLTDNDLKEVADGGRETKKMK